jgi:formate dehydrogenase accessory protein FdhE
VNAWDRRIRRASAIVSAGGPHADLVAFYARVLASQKRAADALAAQPLTGNLEPDLPNVHRVAIAFTQDIAGYGPEQLAQQARALGSVGIDDLLLTYWTTPSDRSFFAKAILQPYAELLRERRIPLSGRRTAPMENRCPGCGGAPQLSILEAGGGATAADGGSRSLLCATCLSTWSFRRVRCPACGEEDERKLVYYQTPDFEHLRVDACETCRRYLKNIDLGRLGLAVPLVDEVAGAALDLWARDRGYEKIELNLVGV